MKNKKITFSLLAVILVAYEMMIVGCARDELNGTTWKSDGAYATTFMFKNQQCISFVNVGLGPVKEIQGKYTISGNTVTITGDRGEKLKGTLSDGVLTIQDRIFIKQ